MRDLHDCHTLGVCVFIITDKEKIGGEEVKGVGVMKDEELKLEEIEVSHTLGGTEMSYVVVIHTWIRQSRGLGQTLPVCVPIT